MMLTYFKNHLRRYRVAQFVNARVKCWRTKRSYEALCRRYQTPSILSNGPDITRLGRRLLKMRNRSVSSREKYTNQRPHVLFVGTDWEQDRSGIIQGLQAVADVTLFERGTGEFGQRWPTSPSEVESVRKYNAEQLLKQLAHLGFSDSVDLIIGQMWGLSMHCRALAVAKERGIPVVNISMDDRHAFWGERLDDGDWGGTIGLVPYLTLACSDAPESVQWYEAEGCPALFLPEASDPDRFRPSFDSKQYDVCFVGSNYGIRAQTVAALQQGGIEVEAYGTGWPNGRIPTEQVPELFARSRVVLGCGTIGYCSDFLALKLRDFDGPMSGSLYITHDNPDLYALYEIGKEIITFRDIPDMITKVKYYLSHEAERESIARSGRERALRDHKWEHRFRSLLVATAQE